MSTTFRFERLGLITSSSCELTDTEDGSKARILCEIPGTPVMEVRTTCIPVQGAPLITSHKAFEAFCRLRFSDQDS